MYAAAIIIELVKVTRNGQAVLVGRTASDRWNLAVFSVDTLADSRNQAEVKALRRKVAKEGFAVRVVKGEYRPGLSDAEADAWRSPLDSGVFYPRLLVCQRFDGSVRLALSGANPFARWSSRDLVDPRAAEWRLTRSAV